MADIITVIVPVYNAQEYLDECLSSIVNQDYKELEIIIVNDGSTDSSPEICEHYAKNDSRVKFFSKQNGGQASARNYALDRMTGNYVTFVDSDDWLRPNYCSELYRLAVNNNADMTGCREFFDDEAFDADEKFAAKIYSKNEFAEQLMPDNISSHIINKLFRAELFSNSTQGGGGTNKIS